MYREYVLLIWFIPLCLCALSSTCQCFDFAKLCSLSKDCKEGKAVNPGPQDWRLAVNLIQGRTVAKKLGTKSGSKTRVWLQSHVQERQSRKCSKHQTQSEDLTQTKAKREKAGQRGKKEDLQLFMSLSYREGGYSSLRDLAALVGLSTGVAVHLLLHRMAHLEGSGQPYD